MVTQAVQKLQPTAGYILLEPVKAQRKTNSGIYLPDSHDEKPQQAKVLAVGPDTKKTNAPCKKNDLVVYKKWGGDEVKLGIGEKEYLFVKFEDILAIIK
ncbi:co-chaperone GroES [Candidatus Beckwithbacteria bacterium CG10_big_fil_rev_8_21_14_0_10_34_10]|uniref:10 kDa chaperonin n=1 Tax=Candidatus Beckwithbacteria bacterium CG10_big_fil_rev_8_21_14_0_10_34_10 TaxID=1974495 RepID=A0A2H0W9H3_9BACT|nr:MAG: co-chaperone GroES [Candidatus Beckwithbacteria bacterium CG10_big_fil_rev_8_21_14_0_10_34_10]